MCFLYFNLKLCLFFKYDIYGFVSYVRYCDVDRSICLVNLVLGIRIRGEKIGVFINEVGY